MTGTVYLRTNRFEVKLEGITFKLRDFETLCSMDFLFPEEKIWVHPPIVGVDVMRHPRDPEIVLMMFCFGVGCVILRFRAGESLPDPIIRFLTDERIHFAGFGIPEKKELFPFEKLGLNKCRVDVGYMAAKFYEDPKYRRCDLSELARKVLGIKRMVGLAEASSFERHEQIKCAICQLFVSSVIGVTLLGQNQRKKPEEETSPAKKTSFLKNLNSITLLNEGWSKLHTGKLLNEGWFKLLKGGKKIAGGAENETPYSSATTAAAVKCEAEEDEVFSPMKKPLRGILKCPSKGLEGFEVSALPSSSSSKEPNLKRANSKGYNVSFN